LLGYDEGESESLQLGCDHTPPTWFDRGGGEGLPLSFYWDGPCRKGGRLLSLDSVSPSRREGFPLSLYSVGPSIKKGGYLSLYSV